jgi:hypothetical protein
LQARQPLAEVVQLVEQRRLEMELHPVGILTVGPAEEPASVCRQCQQVLAEPPIKAVLVDHLAEAEAEAQGELELREVVMVEMAEPVSQPHLLELQPAMAVVAEAVQITRPAAQHVADKVALQEIQHLQRHLQASVAVAVAVAEMVLPTEAKEVLAQSLSSGCRAR